MPLNKNGVKYYTKTVGTFTVFFPEDKTTCEYCKYRFFDSLKISRCRITDEFLAYPTLCVGTNCPLEIDEEGNIWESQL